MSKPISQFITDCGCVIQGVMKDNREISWVYCPTHQKTEHVYSFKREVDLQKPLSQPDKDLIKRLQSSTQSTITEVE